MIVAGLLHGLDHLNQTSIPAGAALPACFLAFLKSGIGGLLQMKPDNPVNRQHMRDDCSNNRVGE